MSKIDNNFIATHYSDAVQPKHKGVEEKKGAKAAEATEQTGKSSPVKLSDAAQKLLEKLKKKYSNMDFMVANYESGSEAKDILSRGTKEYSVLFSADELEKMASDEKYEKEYMDKVEGAVRMSSKISEQFDLGPTSGKGELTNVGISFNSDGTTTLFAELEKTTAQQKERIEAAREKRAGVHKEPIVKKVTVQASTQYELMEKLKMVNWNNAPGKKKATGDKFDFTA